MARKISSIEIKPVDNITGLEGINQRMKSLILTAEGTIPGSRGFGLPADIMGNTAPEAVNLFVLELSEKVDQFIPEVSVSGAEVKMDSLGITTQVIYIERRV